MASAPALTASATSKYGARRADLDEDRLLPVGDLAQLLDLDLEVVRAGPVRVPARAALVDPLRQVAHLGDAVGDLLADQHPAAAGLRALADDDLDRVGAAQVVGVHPVAGGQQLVDERLRALALLGRHAAVARRRARPHRARAAAERLLRRRAQRAEAHPRDRDRDVEVQRLRRVAGAEHDVGVAALAVALERVARHARAEEQQVVEVRDLALGAPPADVVDPLARGALDLVDRVAVERRRLAQARVPAAVAVAVVARALGERVELGHRAPPRTRRRCRPGSCRAAAPSRSGGSRRGRRRRPRARAGRATRRRARRAAPSRCSRRRGP